MGKLMNKLFGLASLLIIFHAVGASSVPAPEALAKRNAAYLIKNQKIPEGRYGRYLAGASLNFEWLDGVDLSYTNFNKANFQEAILDNTIFQGASLVGAWFDLVYARKAIFKGADLRLADFSYGGFDGADFSGADLRMATGLDGASFKNANLSYADLTGTDLQQLNLSGANLTETKLQGAKIKSKGPRATNIRGAFYLKDGVKLDVTFDWLRKLGCTILD